MKILKATYGNKDCTKIVESRIKDGKLIIRANNDIIGDPAVGVVKFLVISYEIAGKEYEVTMKEGGILTIPPSTHTKLGIFYSNNHNEKIYPTIKASLESIHKASIGKADILTNVWRHMEFNPFLEYIAWTQSSSHLNQLLQIMHLLYIARETGKYEYVSFLEHDVLYPEGYFDFPDFQEGEVLTNMNYMGMNKYGFQALGQADEPFHQMTMKFSDAIKHCESILPNALMQNSGLIEPQKIKRIQWACQNPAIHINHGHHFTSHYNIYRKGQETTYNTYWKESKDYSYLFS